MGRDKKTPLRIQEKECCEITSLGDCEHLGGVINTDTQKKLRKF